MIGAPTAQPSRSLGTAGYRQAQRDGRSHSGKRGTEVQTLARPSGWQAPSNVNVQLPQTLPDARRGTTSYVA